MQAKPKKPMTAQVPAGLAARTLAVHLVAGVLIDKQPLEQVLAEALRARRSPPWRRGTGRWRRAVAATVLRRQGELEHVLNAFLERPLPADQGRLWPILLTGAAQLVCLDMPAHAVVDLAVETTRRDRGAHRFAKLVNAVLRRVAERGAASCRRPGRVRLNIPGLAVAALERGLRADAARRIAEASLSEAPLDISVKGRRASLGGAARRPPAADRLDPAPAARPHRGPPGYAEGAWWVQDAAAALVTRIAGDVAAKTVADLCAAPGGKTAAWLPAGAQVTAVDVSAPRLERLRENLQRLASRRRGGRGRCGAPGRRGGPSTWWCSMPPARPRARSAAIPTSCA